jgi:hypothetical protein
MRWQTDPLRGPVRQSNRCFRTTRPIIRRRPQYAASAHRIPAHSALFGFDGVVSCNKTYRRTNDTPRCESAFGMPAPHMLHHDAIPPYRQRFASEPCQGLWEIVIAEMRGRCGARGTKPTGSQVGHQRGHPSCHLGARTNSKDGGNIHPTWTGLPSYSHFSLKTRAAPHSSNILAETSHHPSRLSSSAK